MATHSNVIAWRILWTEDLWWAAVHGVAQSQTRLKQLSMHAYIGEGNGNPLQCYCLEDPVDRGALVGYCPWGRTESDTTEAT